jgi:precorrin-2 dehydrogenase/sirohydrochlorin ferrochelatase
MMLDVTARRVVIVGGGAVAARKAAGLIQAGAKYVVCIAPTFDSDLPDAVQRIVASYEPAHLESAGLVFAATNSPEINRRIVADAHQRGLLVCRADTDADADRAGDFATPARFRCGDVIVTVSAGGNPALAGLIRDQLQRHFDPRWEQMAAALRRLRPAIKASAIDAQRRRAALRALATEAALQVLVNGGVDALREWLARRYPELKNA